ncbi:MmgE/PrpD family protein [Ramlibacter sp. AN1133]|uniref:MmgE/PrpD family protein n=1 Tax=Ramlibacter sp. AN1133 TaxID=3133429 RepID=UPI0030C375B8
MGRLTQQLGAFAAGSGRLDLPEAVRHTVRNGFVDTVATMLAGRNEPVTRIVRRFAEAQGLAVQEASVLVANQRTSSRNAALVNATAGHALDYDDVALQGHPSVVLVPALLAEGERLGASGLDLVRAYVVGYEVWAELIARDADLHHLKGWHPTGVFGTLAVAAAVAALRSLDANQCAHAIALAASMAAGLTANFGSMAKPFHAGQAAAHGIDAVNLAAAGMTGAPDVLEHPTGFLVAVSPQGRVRLDGPAQPLGTTLRIADLGLTVKKYPMCFATHRVIDALLDLSQAHAIAPADVAAVHATVGVAQASMLRNHAPQRALEAKFSLEFAAAAALLVRRVGLAQLTDEFVASPEVQRLMQRVRIATTDTSLDYEPTLAASDRVVVELRDGRRFDSGEVSGTRGDARHPLADGELQAKFRDCCEGVTHLDTARLLDSLLRLPQLPDVRQLTWTRK